MDSSETWTQAINTESNDRVEGLQIWDYRSEQPLYHSIGFRFNFERN